MGSSKEQAPLLSTPVQQQFGSKRSRYPSQPPQVNSWHGELCDFCGPSCSAQDWVSCAFSTFLPFLAYGRNMQRAFRSSIWFHALVFFIFFYGIRWSAIATVSYTADVCKAESPVPEQPAHLPPRLDATAHDKWLSGRKLLQVDDGPGKFTEAFADVLPSAAAKAVIHGRDVEGAQAEVSPAKADENQSGLEHTTTTGEVSAPEDVSSDDCLLERKDGVLACRKNTMPGSRLPHAFILPVTPEYAQATPECQRAFLYLSGVHHLALWAGIGGVIYAARRRTLMRRRFSIPGSRWCDLLTWTFCGACAVCQETRTLRANNVHDGEWDNALQLGEVVTAAEWVGTVAVAPKMVEV